MPNFGYKFKLILILIAINLISLMNKTDAIPSKFRSSPFSYKDRYDWPKIFPNCGGNRQSPVNIDVSKARPYSFGTNLDLKDYYKLIGEIKLTNEGHTVKVNIKEKIKIRGGPIKDRQRFNLEEIHFHFGRNNDGAEHTINFYRHSLEIHFVHRNGKYKDIDEAVNYADGIIVLAILGRIANWNSDYDLLTVNLHRITRPSNVTVPGHFYLSSLVPNIDRFSYWTYEGSLTTPSCQEAVTWIVSDAILPVSYTQLRQFDVLRDGQGEPIAGNARPLQDLNGRKIRHVAYIN